MLDRQRLMRQGKAALLVLGGLFLGLSVAGYDPADPPGGASLPANASPTNPCGPVGALLAHVLHSLLGWGAVLVPVAWLVVVARIVTRRPVADPAGRCLGFGLILLVVSTLLQEFAPGLPRSPVVGGGGYLGAFGLALLKGGFGPVGMALILSSAGLVGIALCHDLVVSVPKRWGRGRGEIAGGVGGADFAGGRVRAAYEMPALEATAVEISERPALSGPSPRARASATTAANAIAPVAHAPSRAMEYRRTGGPFELPSLEHLEAGVGTPQQEDDPRIQQRSMLLEKTLLEHGCQVRVVQIDTGPVITQFEIELEAGLRVSRVVGLANDLAIALAVPSVRIVAPIPGKTTVGIEVPNDRRVMVKLGELVEVMGEQSDQFRIPLFLGKDVKGTPLAFDLASMPHLLIAGRTGTGKSVCLNAMIMSILMTRRPDEVKLILIDPKMVELSQFKQIPHLMHPVITDMKKAVSVLAWACEKMDERYSFLARAGVRNLHGYNALGEDEILNRLRPEDDEEAERIPKFMPHIVIVVDEMADMMMTADKEVEQHIVRLAQKARAVGMHLIVATQKPTVDVVTGLIKGNLPARIAFQVSSRNDSRVVLDEMGADKLLGNGDMLFLVPGTSTLVRAQGTYVSDREVDRVCQFLSQYPQEFSKELMKLQVSGALAGKDRSAALRERDELYEPAIEVIIREGRGSCSLLQRALGIGYGRAARLIDYMAEDGIVGEYKSGGPREVLYTWEDWESLKSGAEAGA